LSQWVSCDKLFTLFGLYGDVVRVKVLFNRKDTALVQMSDNSQAQLAVKNLSRAPLRGRSLSVNFSHHPSITALPQSASEGSADQQLTRDYTGSPLHRYKIRGSKNFQHICAPSRTLHVSNVAPGATEESIQQAFTAFGAVRVRFFPQTTDRRMALVELVSVEASIEALVALHNFQLGDSALRVSFSENSF
jgi:polypyrimidine tract-binding protein 1